MGHSKPKKSLLQQVKEDLDSKLAIQVSILVVILSLNIISKRIAFFVIVEIFRRRIFKKKFENKPVIPWKEEE